MPIEAMLVHQNWHEWIPARPVQEIEFVIRTEDEQRVAEIACVLTTGHHFMLPFIPSVIHRDGLPPLGSGYIAICEHCLAQMSVEVGFDWAKDFDWSQAVRLVKR